MFCPSCGKEIPDSAKFCPLCGSNFVNAEQAAQPAQPVNPTPVQPQQSAQPLQYAQPVQQYQPMSEYVPNQAAPVAEKKFDLSALLKNKAVLIGAAAVIVVILAIILISALGGAGGAGGSYVTVDKMHTVFHNEDGIYVFYGDKQLDDIDGDAVHGMMYSADASALVLYSSEDELFYIKGEKIESIGEYESIEDFIVSDNGASVVIVSYNEGEYVIEMYRNGKVEEIDEFKSYNSPYVKISPNGDTVLYSVYEEDDEWVMYAYDGERIDVGEGFTPVAVSNGGKVAYAINRAKEDKLVYMKNLDEGTKENVASDYYYLGMTNATGEQIMYFTDDYHTMVFDTSMEKPVRVAKSEVYPVFPSNAVGIISNFKSFIGNNDGKLIKYTLKGDEYVDEKIAAYDNYYLSADGGKLAITDGSDIYTMAAKPEAKEKVIYEDLYTDWLYANTDLSKIYFKDEDGNICCNDADNVICDEEDWSTNYEVAYNGTIISINEDDELLYSTGKEFEDADIGEVEEILGVAVNVFFVVSEDELWISTDGKNFENTGIENPTYSYDYYY